MLEMMSQFQLPSYEARVKHGVQQFGARHIKIIEDEAAGVSMYPMAGYAVFGKEEMIHKIEERVERLEHHYDCMREHVLANRWYRRWAKKTRDSRARREFAAIVAPAATPGSADAPVATPSSADAPVRRGKYGCFGIFLHETPP